VSQPADAAVAPGRVEDEWDTSYDAAGSAGEILPFGRFQRVDLNAIRMRCLRKGDPCSFDNLIRRKTLDASALVIIEDVYKAEVTDGFSWRSIIPSGPKSI